MGLVEGTSAKKRDGYTQYNFDDWHPFSLYYFTSMLAQHINKRLYLPGKNRE